MEFIKDQSSSVMEQKPIWESSTPSDWFENGSAGPKVLVVHEDLPTGWRARTVFKNLENWLGTETCFQLSWWRFGMLQDAGLADEALQQAKRADIVFLSMHNWGRFGSDRNLPTAVRNWLLQWLQTRDFKPCALVVSLDSSTQDSLKCNSTLNFLRDITAPLEVDLFLHLGASPLMVRDRSTLVNRHIPVGTSWI
jgi:hypothetical protein